MSELINVFDPKLLGEVTKECPFIKGSSVTFLGDVPGAYSEQFREKVKELGDIEAGYWSIVQIIVKWNFADAKGKELEINVENFKKLPGRLQKWLFTVGTECIYGDKDAKKELPAS
jgi:hypothetical protein